jgi:putative protease
MFKIPELLAPAGGMEQLRAAAENGADAVYLGGKLFNARVNAANFSDAEMQAAIAYARIRGLRLYVTMNTLLRDGELTAALEYAAFLYNAGADALIIQDLGFAALVKRHIPDFPLHLSTQGSIYNPEGVRAAQRLGFRRVVVAREMTLGEIREATGRRKGVPDREGPAEDLPEIEVFVHGALCVCYSGQCQMSREIGGRSGNRGACAQPCRLPYSVCCAKAGRNDGADVSPRTVADSCFALSPKDLCALEHLGTLAEAGVAALKIEGRMKAPEYVAVVTGVYRKYLDRYAKYGRYEVEAADRKDLAQIFNRGGFTGGYLFGNPGTELMSRELSKHQGVWIGQVAGGPREKAAGAQGSRQRGLVALRLEDSLSIGDGVEIRSAALPGNRVTFMTRGGKKVDSAGKGELVVVGYIDGAASPGDKVYKISDKALLERARASYEAKSGAAQKALRKTGLSFRFIAVPDRPVSLSAACEDGTEVTKTLEEAAEQALTKALTYEIVEAQLGKTGSAPFRMTALSAEIGEGVWVSLSKINELRRAVLEEMEVKRAASGRTPVRIDGSRRFGTGGGLNPTPTQNPNPSPNSSPNSSSNPIQIPASRPEEIFLYLYRARGESRANPCAARIYVPYEAMLDGAYRDEPGAVPILPGITKGRHDAQIRERFDEILALSRNGIAVGNPGWIEPFAAAGAKVIGDYGLNLFNSMDFQIAAELGVREAVISHEAAPEDILEMDFHGVTPEVVIKGRIPLMTSEHDFRGDLELSEEQDAACTYFLKDRKGQLYPLLTDALDRRSTILSYRETDLSAWKGALMGRGICRFRIYLE